MRTEEEIKVKYNEMLAHLEILKDKVRNPKNHLDVNINNIQEHIDNENEQHTLNSLIEWVLNK